MAQEVDTRKNKKTPSVPKCDNCKELFTNCECKDNELKK